MDPAQAIVVLDCSNMRQQQNCVADDVTAGLEPEFGQRDAFPRQGAAERLRRRLGIVFDREWIEIGIGVRRYFEAF